jgi:lambda repressor-like predicted transcriptional regulator
MQAVPHEKGLSTTPMKAYNEQAMKKLIKAYQERTGKSLRQLGDKAGVSYNAMARMMAGQEVRTRTIQAVLDAMGYELSYRKKGA